MPVKTYLWDAAAMLETDDDRIRYLVACVEEAPDDAAFFAKALETVARSRSRTVCDSGLTSEAFLEALSEMGNPSLDTVLRVAQAMGYRMKIVADVQPVAKRAAAKRTPPGAQKTARKKTIAKTRRPVR